MKLSRNFQLSEFACKCGCGQMPDPDSAEFKYLASKLQEIRDDCRFPLQINSGFRCKKHNKKVGGASDSSHLKGLAVDISITNDYARLVFMESAIKAGIRRIGIAKAYIHIDTDDDKNNAIWVY